MTREFLSKTFIRLPPLIVSKFTAFSSDYVIMNCVFVGTLLIHVSFADELLNTIPLVKIQKVKQTPFKTPIKKEKNKENNLDNLTLGFADRPKKVIYVTFFFLFFLARRPIEDRETRLSPLQDAKATVSCKVSTARNHGHSELLLLLQVRAPGKLRVCIIFDGKLIIFMQHWFYAFYCTKAISILIGEAICILIPKTE